MDYNRVKIILLHTPNYVLQFQDVTSNSISMQINSKFYMAAR
jgi:hypothetical protein